MKRIKLLPENLINQIAAGEVIERPASAVKELVENSIDAGAKRVEIEISNGGRDIRVADNGTGIHKDDVALAFSRHATSKIEKQKDLWAINTLGFRGEALASIISVAKVTCITRTVDEETGIKVECRDSEIKVSETGCGVGTIMNVKDLFYNIPARLKFLKNPQTEVTNITEVIQNIAVAHPEVAVNLIHKKFSVVKTTGSGDLAATISEIYSKELIKELSEISYEDSQFNLRLNGYVSNPDYTRSNKKGIYVFVNGRTVKCPIISKAVDTVFKDLIPSGKYPFAVLNLIIPSSEIDVNVHPAKKEVKYSKPNLIFNFVYSAIKFALEGNPEFKGFKLIVPEEKEETQTTKVVDFAKFADFREDEIIEVSIPAKKIEQDFSQNKIEFSIENTETPVVNNYKIIGQFDNTYILVETDEGLQIIDQHIAHERHLYEKLKETRVPTSQLLLTSALIEPEAEDILLLQENEAFLANYGFEFEFVEGGIKLKRIPQMLAEKDHEKIVFELIETIDANPANLENEILEKIACHAAVKAGEKLSMWQMEELITIWAGTKFNKTCPHGRKIAHTIPTKEVAKFFGRISV